MAMLDNEMTLPDITESDIENEYFSDAAEFAKNNLDSVVSELGGDGGEDDILLKVYRVVAHKKDQFCFNAFPIDLPLEPRLISEYGGGDYNVRVMIPTANGRGKSLKRQIQISIAEKIESSAGIQQQYQQPQNGLSGQEIVDLMGRNNMDMMRMLKESQLESQLKTQELMLSVFNKKDDSPSIVEQLALLKQLMPEPERVDPMNMLNQMMDMHRNVKAEFSEEPKSETELGALMEGVNGLIGLAKVSGSNDKNPQQNPQQPQEENKNVNVIEKFAMEKMVRNHLTVMTQKAEQGKTPELYADLTIEEVPTKYHKTLYELVGENNTDAFNRICELCPEAAAHPQWFEQYINAIREYFKDLAVMVSEHKTTDEITVTENGDAVVLSDNDSETIATPEQ